MQTIYKNSDREVKRDHRSMCFYDANGKLLADIPFNYSSVADVVTDPATLNSLKAAGLNPNNRFAINYHNKQVSVPVEMIDAIKQAYVDAAAEAVVIEKAEAEKAAHQITIHLSTRGWGDYSSVEWTGDCRTPNNLILAECKSLLANSYDVDQPNQTDDDIIGKINDAKAKKSGQIEAEQKEIDRVNTIIENAKKTGEKQVIDTWITSECSEKGIECSFDQATRYAMPDGSVKITYVHCH